MKKYLVFVLALVSISSMVHAEQSFEVEVKPGGEFKIEIQQDYPSSISPEDAFRLGFLDPRVVYEKDESYSSLDISGTDPLKFDAFAKFTSTLRAKKYMFNIDIRSYCSQKVTNYSIENYCTISTTRDDGGDYFEYGNTSIICSELNNSKTRCRITVKGKPKSINYLVIRRTADRLAISGTSNLLRSMDNVYRTLTNNKSTSKWYKDNIANIWSELMKKTNSSEKLTKTIKAKSSNSGVIVN